VIRESQGVGSGPVTERRASTREEDRGDESEGLETHGSGLVTNVALTRSTLRAAAASTKGAGRVKAVVAEQMLPSMPSVFFSHLNASWFGNERALKGRMVRWHGDGRYFGQHEKRTI
jgi:hypothetical protein